MKNQDRKDYEEGCQIAEQITSVMRNGIVENYDTLQNWILKNESSDEVVEKLTSEGALETILDAYNRIERDQSAEHFVNNLSKRRKIKKRKTIVVWSTSVAATLFALSFLLYINERKDNRVESLQTAYKINSSENRVDKPTLILGNGRDIDLTADNSANKLDLTVSQNTLSYPQKTDDRSEEVIYNTLVIPKMYNYTVELSDGTIVHLNANSELKYPTLFQGDRREVFLKGEGYFEVKKGVKPFLVHVDELEIQVYGTKFNINAYNPLIVKTVLLSGSVGVSYRDEKEIMIEPNQMLTSDLEKGKTQIKTMDCNRYVAWMDGFFRYDDDKIETVLSDFSAWYGVEFTLSDEKQKEIIVTASFLKTTSLDEIISTIELVTNLKFIKTNDAYIVK